MTLNAMLYDAACNPALSFSQTLTLFLTPNLGP